MKPKAGTDDATLVAEGILSAKWNLRIMRVLGDGPARFSGIRAAIPAVSANILAGRLRDLEECGIIGRRTSPPPADCQVYELSELGEAARPVMREIDRWASLLSRRDVPWSKSQNHLQEE
ncbi:helix-turn-helix domain-containing protein [Sphingobium sp.]|uniref:winged helix-turn-helix transcriptional regulator n=1 Tax=Sphingobium sp. TaxID=1912891 RepID=UPI002C46585E|nr:helix-turn-helix domain-containing protein [Sphingobium sp.]HUD92566.1 helix-turn-helix domain-containing protein [Sphingobium sp.]